MWFYRCLAAFGLAMFLHAGLCRLPLKRNILTKFLLAGVPAGILLIGWERTAKEASLSVWAAVALYAFLCELYIFIFASIQTSVSLGLLMVLGGKRMTAREIDGRFSGAGMIRMRLDGLVREGFLTEISKGHYVLTAKGRKFARVFRFCQHFFGHSKSPLLAPRSSKLVS